MLSGVVHSHVRTYVWLVVTSRDGHAGDRHKRVDVDVQWID